jgi:hypothetical protein
MDKVIIGAILLIQSFQTESFKNKIVDICLTISTGMGVYFTLPFQISTNFYAQETIPKHHKYIYGNYYFNCFAIYP